MKFGSHALADAEGAIRAHALRLANGKVLEKGTLADALRAPLGVGCAPILILGASAIVDRRDVIPRAVERAGATLVHLGMPVDPGNLLRSHDTARRT